MHMNNRTQSVRKPRTCQDERNCAGRLFKSLCVVEFLSGPKLKILEEWSGRPGSNRRHPAWEAGVLPLNYSRSTPLDYHSALIHDNACLGAAQRQKLAPRGSQRNTGKSLLRKLCVPCGFKFLVEDLSNGSE